MIYTKHMLINSDRLRNAPVLGLQTGSELARTMRAIIDPGTLKIHAYELSGPLLDKNPSLLRIVDVREISDIGLIVDSSDEFVSVDDVIKLGDLYRLGFEPMGMQVVDLKGSRLGKVSGYTLTTEDFLVYQLTVKRPFLKSLNDTELLIHRSQITEINDKAIIVREETAIPEPLPKVRASYVNPFRSKPAPEQSSSNS
jgi:sporulation protein YlmC with PRC-barrel domain